MRWSAIFAPLKRPIRSFMPSTTPRECHGSERFSHASRTTLAQIECTPRQQKREVTTVLQRSLRQPRGGCFLRIMPPKRSYGVKQNGTKRDVSVFRPQKLTKSRLSDRIFDDKKRFVLRYFHVDGNYFCGTPRRNGCSCATGAIKISPAR